MLAEVRQGVQGYNSLSAWSGAGFGWDRAGVLALAAPGPVWVCTEYGVITER